MLDKPEDIRRKIRKAVVSPRVIEDNGLLALVQYILLPTAGLKGKREFGICKQESTEPFMYGDIETIHEDYKNDVVSTDPSRSSPTTSVLTCRPDHPPGPQGGRRRGARRAHVVDPRKVRRVDRVAGHQEQGLPHE